MFSPVMDMSQVEGCYSQGDVGMVKSHDIYCPAEGKGMYVAPVIDPVYEESVTQKVPPSFLLGGHKYFYAPCFGIVGDVSSGGNMGCGTDTYLCEHYLHHITYACHKLQFRQKIEESF